MKFRKGNWNVWRKASLVETSLRKRASPSRTGCHTRLGHTRKTHSVSSRNASIDALVYESVVINVNFIRLLSIQVFDQGLSTKRNESKSCLPGSRMPPHSFLLSPPRLRLYIHIFFHIITFLSLSLSLCPSFSITPRAMIYDDRRRYRSFQGPSVVSSRGYEFFQFFIYPPFRFADYSHSSSKTAIVIPLHASIIRPSFVTAPYRPTMSSKTWNNERGSGGEGGGKVEKLWIDILFIFGYRRK